MVLFWWIYWFWVVECKLNQEMAVIRRGESTDHNSLTADYIYASHSNRNDDSKDDEDVFYLDANNVNDYINMEDFNHLYRNQKLDGGNDQQNAISIGHYLRNPRGLPYDALHVSETDEARSITPNMTKDEEEQEAQIEILKDPNQTSDNKNNSSYYNVHTEINNNSTTSRTASSTELSPIASSTGSISKATTDSVITEKSAQIAANKTKPDLSKLNSMKKYTNKIKAAQQNTGQQSVYNMSKLEDQQPMNTSKPVTDYTELSNKSSDSNHTTSIESLAGVREDRNNTEKESLIVGQVGPHASAETSRRTMSEGGIVFSSFSLTLIIGICVAVLSVVSIIATLSVVAYKRYYWNKPRTFSDKCSNTDSTGYIDDALKDNSEEMYSLDNDSFLNSLEAMTIQNYWADSIRHTKL